jgi:hypothetical protein
MLHSREFSQGSGWVSVMTVQEKCDEKNGLRSSRFTDTSTPTLRNVREGWGIRSVVATAESEGPGPAPKFSMSEIACSRHL